MDILEVIKARRSTRKFLARPLAEEDVTTILKAGAYAPSGGNSQSTHFLVLRNREKIMDLCVTAAEEFAKLDEEPGMYRSFLNTIRRAKQNSADYDFTYGAPVFVLLANKRGYDNAMADCALAAENMFLQATAMGIGSCYINQIHWMTDNERVLAKLHALGMGEDERVLLGVALGYSGMGKIPPLERFGNPVTYVD